MDLIIKSLSNQISRLNIKELEIRVHAIDPIDLNANACVLATIIHFLSLSHIQPL